jgi:hypothetical protein
MFLLQLLPDAFLSFIVNGILIAGILGFSVSFFFGYVAHYVPQIIPYRIAIQIASIIVLVLGVYLKGGMSTEMVWRERVRELEAKVAIAEQQSKEANVELESKIKEKVRVVKETQVVIQERIKTVQVNIDSQCKVTSDTVDILNKAAEGAKK